jgi:protein O-mannosyl-transferase
MIIRKPFQILLLCVVVFSIYYVSMFSEISLLDDRDAVIELSKIEHIDLKTIFFPNSAKGEYYRPLIGVLYMIDRFVWDLDPRVMHLENIFFHLLNVLLFFMVSRELLKKFGEKTRYLPLLSSLLFAVHPMATESVNWISGRTDLLAGMFILFATLILIRFRENRPWWYWPAIGISVLCGMLAKETALAFFFTAFFLFRMNREEPCAMDWKDGQNPWRGVALLTAVFYLAAVLAALFTYNYFMVFLIIAGYGTALCFWDIGTPRREYVKIWIGMAVSICVPVALFFIVRKFVYASDIASIPQTITLILFDPVYAFKVFTGAVAFYVKEFLFPFPLNLAIREIDPLYELLGILLLILVMLFIRLAGRCSSLALGGLCMIAPALPLSLGTVAWTAYAERYVYLAIPFWLLAASIAWSRISTVRPRFHVAGPVFAVLLLIVWGRWTYERNVTWQTNLAMFDDTVRKTPNFKVVRGLYMLALYENGKFDEALEQYRIASTIPSIKYDEKFDVLYALIQMRKGRTEEARITFEKVLQKKETVSVLENLIKLLKATRSPLPTNDPTRQKTDALVIQYYEKLYSKTGDAIYLYRLGQDYLNNGKRAEAKITFTRAAERLPDSSEFKKYARNLAMKL